MTDAVVAQAQVTEEQARLEVNAFCEALYIESEPGKMTENDRSIYDGATELLVRACVRGAVVFDSDTFMPKVIPQHTEGFSEGLVFRRMKAADLVPPNPGKKYSDEQRFMLMISALTGQPTAKISKLDFADYKVCSAVQALFTLG